MLYSTVFAVTAAHSRLFADFLAMVGVYDGRDFHRRMQLMRLLLLPLIFIPCLTFLYVREPVVMVKISGITQAVLLPVIGFSTLYLRYRLLPAEIGPRPWLTLALWVTSAAMLFVMLASLVYQLS